MVDQGTEQVAREAIERVIVARDAHSHGAGRLPEPNLDPPPANLPEPVRTAMESYATMPEWLVNSTFRHLCRVPSAAGELYLLVHGFESTDGWLEVFGSDGTPQGAAQYVGGRVGWATVDEVRGSIQTGQRVPSLNASLSWVDVPRGSRSECGRFTVAKVAKKWRLSMGGQVIQDWNTLQEAQAHAEALALPAE